MNTRIHLVSLLLLGSICVIAAPSFAQPSESNSDLGKKRVVMISPESDKEAIQPFVDAIRAQLSDLEVEFDVSWLGDDDLKKQTIEQRAKNLAAEKNTSAVFWCDLHRSGGPALYMSIPELDRVLVRRLGGVNEGGMAETTGIIVRASVDAMLRGLSNFVYTAWMDLAELEKTLEESAALETEQKKPTIEITGKIVTDADKGERLLIGVAYALEVMSADHGVSHGVAMDLNLRIVGGLHGFLGYTLFPHYVEEGDIARLTLMRHLGSVGGRYLGSIGAFTLGGSLGVSLDTAIETKNEGIIAGAQTEEEATHLGVSIVPALEMGFAIADNLHVFLLVNADIRINRRTYNEEISPGVEQAIVSPWRIRPAAHLGFSLGLF